MSTPKEFFAVIADMTDRCRVIDQNKHLHDGICADCPHEQLCTPRGQGKGVNTNAMRLVAAMLTGTPRQIYSEITSVIIHAEHGPDANIGLLDTTGQFARLADAIVSIRENTR